MTFKFVYARCHQDSVFHCKVIYSLQQFDICHVDFSLWKKKIKRKLHAEYQCCTLVTESRLQCAAACLIMWSVIKSSLRFKGMIQTLSLIILLYAGVQALCNFIPATFCTLLEFSNFLAEPFEWHNRAHVPNVEWITSQNGISSQLKWISSFLPESMAAFRVFQAYAMCL